jgi:hypothetical protein
MPLPGDAGEAGEVVALPLAPDPALEPDLLKWASHSERETTPSLFVSTEEKVGADVLLLALPPLDPPDVALPPEAALPPEDDVPDAPLDMPEEPLELPPAAAGDDEDLSLLVVLDEELCASATLDSANSAAAVAALNTLRLNI